MNKIAKQQKLNKSKLKSNKQTFDKPNNDKEEDLERKDLAINSNTVQDTNERDQISEEKDAKTLENDWEVKSIPLTLEQKALIELNRQKALLIRQDKVNKRRINEALNETKAVAPKVIRINDSKLVDTGGGFFIEEKPNELTEEDVEAAMLLVTDPPPLFKDDQPFCNECSQPFDNSYLNHNFNEIVCDNCRDRDDKHALITKTDAKNNYLLKDCDFDKRIPPLKFIVRKNPHNSQWGDMKLYLKLQVERRALEVWGTEEALEEAIEKQDEKRQLTKQKRYMKKMKELRMNVRSSLYTKSTKNHEHEYGDEVYHSEDDEYSKTCNSCGHTYKYDKM